MAPETTPRADYAFKRDFRSSIRLNHNHWLIKELTGYLIHPAITADDPYLRIADLGSGTNIWALEVAAQLPDTARIDAFDISGDQFAPATSRPANLHLHLQDCFKPFPAEFVGSFDIVHARFWLCLVNNPDAPELLKNMVSLLKPGGYVQWLEPLALAAIAVHPPSANNSKTAAVDRFTSHWHKPTENKTYDWIENLPDLYRAQGLEVIATDRIPLKQHLRHAWSQSVLATIDDRAAQSASSSENAENGVSEGSEVWMLQLIKAFKNASYVDTPFFCVVGRKVG